MAFFLVCVCVCVCVCVFTIFACIAASGRSNEFLLSHPTHPV